MARKDLKAGTLLAPLPAALVTVRDGEEDNVMTAAWTGILSSDPPRAYVSIRPTRHTHGMLTRSREFALHLTTEELAHATDYCGVYTGAKVDKFEKCHLTKLESKCVGAPTIAQAPIVLECRVFDVIPSGTHDIFLADIVHVTCDEALLDEGGRLRLEKAGLLAYAHGEYFTLGKPVGKFGFSAARQKRKKTSARPRSEKKG